MSDNETAPSAPASPHLASGRFARVETIVRWAFWLAMAGAFAYVFVDLLVQH